MLGGQSCRRIEALSLVICGQCNSPLSIRGRYCFCRNLSLYNNCDAPRLFQLQVTYRRVTQVNIKGAARRLAPLMPTAPQRSETVGCRGYFLARDSRLRRVRPCDFPRTESRPRRKGILNKQNAFRSRRFVNRRAALALAGERNRNRAADGAVDPLAGLTLGKQAISRPVGFDLDIIEAPTQDRMPAMLELPPHNCPLKGFDRRGHCDPALPNFDRW